MVDSLYDKFTARILLLVLEITKLSSEYYLGKQQNSLFLAGRVFKLKNLNALVFANRTIFFFFRHASTNV